MHNRLKSTRVGLWLVAAVLLATSMFSSWPHTMQGRQCPVATQVALSTPSVEDDQEFVQCRCDEKEASDALVLAIFAIPACVINIPMELHWPVVQPDQPMARTNQKTDYVVESSPSTPPPNRLA